MKKFLVAVIIGLFLTGCGSAATAKDNTPKPPETQWSTITQGNILYTDFHTWHGTIDGKECIIVYGEIHAGYDDGHVGEAPGLSCNWNNR